MPEGNVSEMTKKGPIMRQIKTGLRSKWRERFMVLYFQERELKIFEKEPSNDSQLSGREAVEASYLVALKTTTLCTKCEKANIRRSRRHNIFTIKMAEEDGEKSPTKAEVTLSAQTPEEREDWVREINDVINGKFEPIKTSNEISVELFDEVKVETDALQHLNKSRPKFYGRRRPRKRPLAVLEEEDEGAEKKQKTANSSPSQHTDDRLTPSTAVDSDAEQSKGPSSSCSHDNMDDTDHHEGKKLRQKKNKKGTLTNTSPSHTEVKRRQKSERGSSFLKRLSNRFSQVFGHGSMDHGDGGGDEGVKDKKNYTPSLDSFEVSEDTTERDDFVENLNLISEKAELLLKQSRELHEQFKREEKTQGPTTNDLKNARFALRYVTKSFDSLSLIERKGTEDKEE